MEKTIFFNYPVGTEKLRFIVTSLSIKDLKNEGIIPRNSTALELPLIDENSSLEETALVSFPDRCVFDNYRKPTKVMLDADLMNSFIMSEIKTARAECLTLLDNYQMRATARNNQSVLEQIEADKQKLRDIPETLDFGGVTTFKDACKVIPLVDVVPEPYISKYEDALR